jgi:uncharacterized protein DUF397
MSDLNLVHWRKSSRSDENGGHCAEIAGLPFVIAVRDSKNPNGPKLTLTTTAWRTFTHQIKANEHDLA